MDAVAVAVEVLTEDAVEAAETVARAEFDGIEVKVDEKDAGAAELVPDWVASDDVVAVCEEVAVEPAVTVATPEEVPVCVAV